MCEVISSERKPKDNLPADAKVRRWLSESGRDIELRVARAAWAAGGVAVQSVIYVDPIEGKHREADVMAEFDGREGSGILRFM